MKIIPASYKILDEFAYPAEMLKKIERHGRTCYKSEDNITKDSAEKFIRELIKNGHESVLEHVSVSVKIICDQGISHELVRHRIASYSQESTRYCNYSKNKFENELTFIRPLFWPYTSIEYKTWLTTMQTIENEYLDLINIGTSPQQARLLLPNSLKTEIDVTMNLRSGRNFFKQRTTNKAHPQMREIAIPLLKDMQKLLPPVFEDIIPFEEPQHYANNR